MPRKVASPPEKLPPLPRLFKTRAAALKALKLYQTAMPELATKLVATADHYVCMNDACWTDFLTNKIYHSIADRQEVLCFKRDRDYDWNDYKFSDYYSITCASQMNAEPVHKSTLTSKHIGKFQFNLNFRDQSRFKDGYYINSGKKGLSAPELIPHFGSADPAPLRYMECISDMFVGRSGVHYYNRHQARTANDDPPHEIQQDIRAYHDSTRSWNDMEFGVEHNQWLHAKDRLKNHQRKYGIELEIECNDESDRPNVCRIASRLGLLAEDDGSLDDYRGVEIIGPPLTYQEVHDPKGIWLMFLEQVKGMACGWSAGLDTECSYGMHVSLNRMAMTPATAGKIYNAFHSMEDLCVAVAGRRGGDFHEYISDDDFTKHQLQKSTPTVKRVICGYRNAETPKYESASVRTPSRLEVRIFRSCLNADRFLRNVQFCSAMWDWAVASSIQTSGSEECFLRWFGSVQYYYPELACFLANRHLKKPMFKVYSSKVKKLMTQRLVEA